MKKRNDIMYFLIFLALAVGLILGVSLIGCETTEKDIRPPLMDNSNFVTIRGVE